MDETLFEPVETVGGVASVTVATRLFTSPVRHLLLANAGAVPIYFRFGAPGITIESLDDCDVLLPYSKELFGARGATSIVWRTESGTSRLCATSGYGEL